jgi:hypothetical protein
MKTFKVKFTKEFEAKIKINDEVLKLDALNDLYGPYENHGEFVEMICKALSENEYDDEIEFLGPIKRDGELPYRYSGKDPSKAHMDLVGLKVYFSMESCKEV